MTLVDELRLAALELRRAACAHRCAVEPARLEHKNEALALEEAADRAASLPGQYALGRARLDAQALRLGPRHHEDPLDDGQEPHAGTEPR